jgi:DNA transformation protein
LHWGAPEVANEFVEHILEQLLPLGGVRAKRMFGGYGVYLEELFFAIIVDDTLYLKADDANRGYFETLGLRPFRYHSKGKELTMSYYPLPDNALEDREEMLIWARRSVEAALRAVSNKAGSRRKR